MNSSGDIREFKTKALAEAEGYKEPLTRQEAHELQNIGSPDRARKLALIRFMVGGKRNELPAADQQRIENAFNMGWKAAKE